MTPLQSLEHRFHRAAALSGAAGILSWDRQTMMPDGAAEGRGEQMAVIHGIVHEMITAPEVAELLATAEAATSGLSVWQQANLREMRRRHTHASALPADLVEAITKAESRCEMTWRSARAEGDFKALLPDLRALFTLVMEAADAKGAALGLARHDALIDEYDPGNTVTRIDRVFDPVADFLPDLIQRVIDHQARQGAPLPLDGPFDVAAQKDLGLDLMARMGFDFSRGRLDVSLHPFTGGARDDVRLTTRYDDNVFMSALMGVLHETGHGVYEQGLPRDHRFQPVGDSRGLTIHESQSLIIEMQAARTDAFLDWLAPVAAAAFGRSGPAWRPENFRWLNRRVQRTFIRVEADEVTYPAHVIVRHRLEKALIGGALDLADLPEAWNAMMTQLLGVTPPDDRQGCLQDIHWPSGAFGYFPTYTLGAMAAAQLYQAAGAEDRTIPAALGVGDFRPLVAWLRDRVHQRGCLDATADDLLIHATGRPLDPTVFKAHLEARYLG